MAQQIIFRGTVADDGTGDDLRTAFGKVNDNFTELYSLHDSGGPTEPAGSDTSKAFSTVSEAQSAIIPDNITAFTVNGFYTAGDNVTRSYVRDPGTTHTVNVGGGTFTVSGLDTVYTGGGFPAYPGNPTMSGPPGFVSGAPNLVFGSTYGNTNLIGVQGPTTQPIVAGSLVVVCANMAGGVSPVSSFQDSVGNTYVLGPSAVGGGGNKTAAIYYCSNPIAAPLGVTFPTLHTNPIDIKVYCVPGFAGATLDQTAVNIVDGGAADGVSLSTGPLVADFPQLVFGFVTLGQDCWNTPGNVIVPYTPPAGWLDIAPPTAGRGPISSIAVNSAAPVTFHPTWSGTFPVAAVIATFSKYNRTALNRSYWKLNPSWPIHVHDYGISASVPDNESLLKMFGNWLSTIVPPSSTSVQQNGPAAGSCTISIASPAVVTVTTNQPGETLGPPYPHGYHSGQMIAFFGNLPDPLVSGRRYFIQYGSVTPTTFQISETGILNGGAGTTAKGPSIVTTSGSTGPFSYEVYGENWAEVVFDPGFIYASGNQFIDGYGLKRLRAVGYGCSLQNSIQIFGSSLSDANSNTSGTSSLFTAQLATTVLSGDSLPTTVTLLNPALASNFYVNGWVALMQGELQSGKSANQNNHTFEYRQIRSISGADITFYDPIRYMYSQNLPFFALTPASWAGGGCGPVTIEQLTDAFDQYVELRGFTINGTNEEGFGGVQSIKCVDCVINAWGFKTGPFPTLLREFIYERCLIHSGSMEVDKMVDFMLFKECRGDWDGRIFFQSSGCNVCVIDQCDFPSLFGTPKNMIIRNTVINGVFTIGIGYGITERLFCERVDAYRVDIVNDNIRALTQQPGLSITSGVLTQAANTGGWNPATPGDGFSGCPFTFGVIGGKGLIINSLKTSGSAHGAGVDPAGGLASLMAFTMYDVYQDGSVNYCINTDLPSIPTTSFTAHCTTSIGTTGLSVLGTFSPSDACILNGMDVAGPGLPVAAAISSLSWSASLVTVTTAAPHGLPISTTVPITIAGVTPGGYNGRFSCFITSTTQFLYSLYSNPGAVSVPGTYQIIVTIAADIGVPNATGNVGTYTMSQNAVSTQTNQVFTFTTPLIVRGHPAARATFRSCSGGRFMSDQAGSPDDIPLYSYFRRAFNGLPFATFFPQTHVYIDGNLVGGAKSWTINVTKLYTGTGTMVCNIYIFGWKNDTGNNWYPTFVKQTIDLMTKGVRSFTAGGVVALGADSLVACPFWLSGGHLVETVIAGGTGTLADMPRFEMTAQTDQCIGAASVFVNDAISGLNILADTHLGANL